MIISALVAALGLAVLRHGQAGGDHDRP